MRRTKKDKKVRPRNWVVLLMAENTRNEVFKDRKKEDDKRRCRRPIKDE